MVWCGVVEESLGCDNEESAGRRVGAGEGMGREGEGGNRVVGSQGTIFFFFLLFFSPPFSSPRGGSSS